MGNGMIEKPPVEFTSFEGPIAMESFKVAGHDPVTQGCIDMLCIGHKSGITLPSEHATNAALQNIGNNSTLSVV